MHPHQSGVYVSTAVLQTAHREGKALSRSKKQEKAKNGRGPVRCGGMPNAQFSLCVDFARVCVFPRRFLQHACVSVATIPQEASMTER